MNIHKTKSKENLEYQCLFSTLLYQCMSQCLQDKDQEELIELKMKENLAYVCLWSNLPCMNVYKTESEEDLE